MGSLLYAQQEQPAWHIVGVSDTPWAPTPGSCQSPHFGTRPSLSEMCPPHCPLVLPPLGLSAQGRKGPACRQEVGFCPKAMGPMEGPSAEKQHGHTCFDAHRTVRGGEPPGAGAQGGDQERRGPTWGGALGPGRLRAGERTRSLAWPGLSPTEGEGKGKRGRAHSQDVSNGQGGAGTLARRR